MKYQVVIMILATSMVMSSFTTTSSLTPEQTAAKQLALSITDALQHQSTDSYISLFPSLQEFHQLMENNKGIYGTHLAEAQENFASEYSKEILPAVQKSFARLLEDGEKRGIDWGKISLIETHVTEKSEAVTLRFTTNNKDIRIEVKPIHVNGQLKVTQFIKLI